MPKVQIEYTEEDLRRLVIKDIQSQIDYPIDESDVKILVKSKQNYRSEWESAAFKATIEKDVK